MTDEATPAEIGRYRVETVLGRGAMGVVYRAHDPVIDRAVAIKLIRADLQSGDERSDYIQRFHREAQAAGRCTHPNIVAIYDYATHEENPFLAMEYVDGISLDRARTAGGLVPADAVFIVLQILDALGAAHALGITHRDIKPANIILVGGRLVKVADFGIARLDNFGITGAGTVIGTPSYMSPEQCRGDVVDPRSDLFSTAVVLYELLCGERPFAGKNGVEIAQRLLGETPADLHTRTPAVSPALSAAVRRGLEKHPADRYATAAAMAAALRAAMAGDPAAATLSERTVVLAQRRPDGAKAGASSGSGSLLGGTLDPGTLTSLERRLAEYIGPIARVLVQGAVRDSDTIEALCDRLASSVSETAAQSRFRADALAELRRGTRTVSAMGVATVPSAERERAQRALTQYMGPIARVLVQRAATEARSVPDFLQRLADHIDNAAERQTFLRQASDATD